MGLVKSKWVLREQSRKFVMFVYSNMRKLSISIRASKPPLEEGLGVDFTGILPSEGWSCPEEGIYGSLLSQNSLLLIR